MSPYRDLTDTRSLLRRPFGKVVGEVRVVIASLLVYDIHSLSV